jgi:hypothetical protein
MKAQRKVFFNDTWFIATDQFFAMGVSSIRYAQVQLKYHPSAAGLPAAALDFSVPVARRPNGSRPSAVETEGLGVDKIVGCSSTSSERSFTF